MRFRNKVVLVTGGGQGIGRAIAWAFAREGALVVIADLDVEAAVESLAYIEKTGGHGFYVNTDISQEQSVHELFDKITTCYGKLNFLVNNAGISYKGDLGTDSMEIWDRVVNTNLRGTYMCAKFAAPLLKKEKGGVIINIASTRAFMSEPGSEAYAASKGGIIALTHALATSLGPNGIRVNAISPGWIEVSDWKKSVLATNPIHSENDRSQHPVGRVGQPEDIAEACLFLASAEAGFITGTNLTIDGGMTIKMIYQE